MTLPKLRKALAWHRRDLSSRLALEAAERTKALAEADKARAEADKAVTSAWKDRTETVRATGVAFAVLYGMVALFCYCFFKASFIPSGVSVGDTLLFAFLALALGLIGAMIAGCGVVAWLPILFDLEPARVAKASDMVRTRFWGAAYIIACLFHAVLIANSRFIEVDWLAKPLLMSDLSSEDKFVIAFFLLSWLSIAWTSWKTLRARGCDRGTCSLLGGGGGFLVTVGLELVRLPFGWIFILCALIAGSFLSVALDTSRTTDGEVRKKPVGATLAGVAITLLFPVFVAALVPDGAGIGIAPLTFGKLGLYTKDAALQVNAANLQTLTAAADLQGDPLDVCRAPDGSAVVTGLTVWWHGIGTRSQVELAHRTGRGVLVDLDATQARLIRNQHGHCRDLPGAYFESGVATMTAEGEAQLTKTLDRWLSRSLSQGPINQIRIIGHADPMAPGSATTNQKLSKLRADAVDKVLRGMKSMKSFYADTAPIDDRLRIEGSSTTLPLKDCALTRSDAERRECNAINRRVELRVVFGLPPVRGAASAAARQRQRHRPQVRAHGRNMNRLFVRTAAVGRRIRTRKSRFWVENFSSRLVEAVAHMRFRHGGRCKRKTAVAELGFLNEINERQDPRCGSRSSGSKVNGNSLYKLPPNGRI